MSSIPDLTQLIGAAAAGDEEAKNRLYERAYPELRRLAHSRLFRHGGAGDMQTTELLSESFLRYVAVGDLRVQDRVTFFSYASNIMRSVIFDSVRALNAEKRGGGNVVSLSTEIADRVGIEVERFLDLESALKQMEEVEPRLAQVVDMRFFGGLDWEEIATALEVSSKTVRRDWERARLLLRAMLI
ncbi:MAG: ECF-type sigma factor [Casimicrobium sp.]